MNVYNNLIRETEVADQKKNVCNMSSIVSGTQFGTKGYDHCINQLRKSFQISESQAPISQFNGHNNADYNYLKK